jgi:hypothetical protein
METLRRSFEMGLGFRLRDQGDRGELRWYSPCRWLTALGDCRPSQGTAFSMGRYMA